MQVPRPERPGLAGIHRNSGIRFYHRLRCAIATAQQNRAAQFCGSVEVDENYLLAAIAKAKEAEALLEKSLCLAF